MNAKKGYLCEHCRQNEAKYEARFVLEGRNSLLCLDCLQELNPLFSDIGRRNASSDLTGWSGPALEDPPIRDL
jgi:hypothetical protein